MSDNEFNDAPAPAAPEPVETEVEDTGEDLVATPEVEAEAAKPAEQKKVEAILKKAYDLQVNGKSKKVELDINDDKEVKKYLQKAMAADEKFEEAALTRKQAEQLVEMLQKDPLSILKNPALGLNIRKLAEDILLQDLEDQAKTPEQKELEEARNRLKAYEEEKAKLKKDHDESLLKQRQMENQKSTEESMIKAFDNSVIPPTPFAVRRVADILVSAIESGWEDATIEQIMPYAEEVILKELQDTVRKHGDPDKLEKLLGKDILDGYRKSKVSKLKKAPQTASQIGQSTSGKKAEDDKKEQTQQPKKIKLSEFPW